MQTYTFKIIFQDDETILLTVHAPSPRIGEIRARNWAENTREIPVKTIADVTSEIDAVLAP